MFLGLNHVGIAVADIDVAVALYTGKLGGSLIRRGNLDGLDFALVDSGGVELELLHATDIAEGIGKFLAERGPGLHHLAYTVDDIHAEVERMVGEGFEQSGEIRVGVHGTPIVFFHPRSVGGVLTELVERHA
ncbi:MAG TPA: VOC family protein [Candidatus Dormibacteraeota bacterium]|nr:VOC family protein [Candidatus Dormibacteraeota bacterium]